MMFTNDSFNDTSILITTEEKQSWHYPRHDPSDHASVKNESRKKYPEKWSPKNGPTEKKFLMDKKSLQKLSLGKNVPGKKTPRKMVPGEMVFKKFYSTHKHVTVIFAFKYRRILLVENEFVVEFWVHRLRKITEEIQYFW